MSTSVHTHVQRRERPPTARQLEVLSAIDAQMRLRGFAPTMRELMGALGLRSTNALAGLADRLRDRGLLQPAPFPVRTRHLALTVAGHEALAARRFAFFPVAQGVVVSDVRAERIGSAVVLARYAGAS